jgi:hypothetical protein
MFLSDELAAIGRQDHQVYPFPRSLRVRSSTLALTDLSRSAANAPVWLDKMIVDIEQVRQGSLGTAVPIGKVVILHDAKMTGEDNASVAGGKRMLGILVDRLDDDLVASIERIEGVSDVSVDDERGFPMIRLWASRRTDALLRVEALCQRRQILVLDVIKREQKAATFAGRARLEHIPKSQATLELLRRFQGGHKSALLKDEFDGSATRLFMELGVVLSQADCFRLYVGSLNEMADLVCDLVETR